MVSYGPDRLVMKITVLIAFSLFLFNCSATYYQLKDPDKFSVSLPKYSKNTNAEIITTENDSLQVTIEKVHHDTVYYKMKDCDSSAKSIDFNLHYSAIKKLSYKKANPVFGFALGFGLAYLPIYILEERRLAENEDTEKSGIEYLFGIFGGLLGAVGTKTSDNYYFDYIDHTVPVNSTNENNMKE